MSTIAFPLCLFLTRFIVSVALAINPDLWQGSSTALAAGFIYGAFSGIFLARSLVTWRLARQARPYGVPG
jgi:preprotein translocase subunit SecF